MTIDKANMDWYRQEHLRIVEQVQEELRNEPRLKALIIRPVEEEGPRTAPRNPEPWEEWLKAENKDAYYTLQRLRARANEIWISGSGNDRDRGQFIISVEMEYQLSIWAARQYLKQVEIVPAI